MTGPALIATAQSITIDPPLRSSLKTENQGVTDRLFDFKAIKTTSLKAQRKTFLAADTALKKGQLKRYRRLKAQLGDYPLLPYLEYEYIRKRLHRLPDTQIEDFLQQYNGSPLQLRLLNSWLSKLAKNGHWEKYLTAYQPTSSTRQQCLNRWALYKTGQQEQAFAGIEKIWLVGRSQSRSCNKIFSAWQKAGNISTEQVWHRFQLAMKSRKMSLAKYMVKLLPADQKPWARLWLRVHRQPDLITKDPRFARYHPMRNQILVHGIKRQAYRHLDQAVLSWDNIQHRYPFNDNQRNEIERSLALRHALKGHPEALNRLTALSTANRSDPVIGEWRVRTALDQQNWQAVLEGLDQLNEKAQNSYRWRYWRARALEALNQHTKAYKLYGALAQNRSYYGFLAADRVGVSYQFDDQPVLVNNDDIQHLEQLPGLVRARELFALNRTLDARREWLHSTRNLSEPRLQQAALIAHQWGWHDRAILTMARTRFRDDLTLRFPLAYRDKVSLAARKQRIDPALAFALIRQESAFTADIRSPAGAMGLMQLMPATARQTARKMGVRLSHRLALTDASINLKLGMSHLRQVLDSNFNHPVLATAAYNAGEHRVKQWMPKQGSIPADIWAETIPFKETRNYVQNIMLFMTIYEQHLGLPVTTLQQRMPAINATNNALLAKNHSAGHRSNPS